MSDPRLSFELGVVALGNTVFEGHNNSYLLGLETDATTTLVDTGVAIADTREALRAGLVGYGLAFEDIERILLTHHHGDHSGLSGEIQAESGCEVFVHEADAELVGSSATGLDRLRECLIEWGMPEAKRTELLAFLDAADIKGPPPDLTTFAGGERFDLGSVEVEAVEMPGHTLGHTGFVFDGHAGEEVFTGDALLPYYTPNVGGADVRVEAALEKYLRTLSAIVEVGYSRAWPGHRGPIIDPAGRAADIVSHHRERTGRVVSALREGPKTAWEVSVSLFGSLSSIHVLHGPGEAYAHLEHLRAAGVVAREDGHYALLEADPDLDLEIEIDGLFPDLSGMGPGWCPRH